MTTRRVFLASLFAAASLPRIGWAAVGNPACLAAGKLGDGYVLHGLAATGESLFQIDLPARGHAAAAHPQRAEAVAFARRPGSFALVIDCATGEILHRLTPPEGRQFNGHGTYSAAGDLLLTSEVVAEGSAGRIGLWETAGYTRIGEWSSHGIGPHDIRRLKDGRIAIANGGIQTDPADRRKLNLDQMQPNLVLLSAEGTLQDTMRLPADLRQNSIRHLALLPDGLAFAMQWEGDPAQPVPQLGLWTPGTPPLPCPAPEPEALAMRGYAGSIAVNATGDRIALTSAPGGVAMIFDAAGQPLQTLPRADICGVAALPSGFLFTDGQGAVWSWAEGDTALTLLARHQTLWDNHLVPLG